jgi:hypothetical protein
MIFSNFCQNSKRGTVGWHKRVESKRRNKLLGHRQTYEVTVNDLVLVKVRDGTQQAPDDQGGLPLTIRVTGISRSSKVEKG